MSEHAEPRDMLHSRVLALSLLASLVGCGCAALERTHDCSGLVELVNEGLADVRFEAPDAGDPETYERFALTYDDVARKITELSIDDPTLSKAAGSYREVLERAAKHSRSYASQLSGPSEKGQRRSAERRMEKIRAQAKTDLTREASAVRKINTLCHPR